MFFQRAITMVGAPFVTQASCLWGDRASRLVDYFFSRLAAASPSRGRQDARRPHSQDGCAPITCAQPS